MNDWRPMDEAPKDIPIQAWEELDENVLPKCQSCGGATRLDGIYLCCDHCQRVVGGRQLEITLVE